MTTKSNNTAGVQGPKLVSLADLCAELKIKPREARMILRLAVSKKHEYPALSDAHVPRQPWQWAKGSKALTEAKKALTANQDA
ncbi:hypothetical protein [Parasphingorhabdus sp.]|uniref:hypothetical protein n=1 Tax=Parasphingorhabdus sp. TaxID=2709688 RepID=UPI003D29C236